MSEPRFQVLPENQLTVWDAQEQKTIHLGSRVEAIELAELLNSMQDKIKAQSLVLLRQTGQINFLELEVARLTNELDSTDFEEDIE